MGETRQRLYPIPIAWRAKFSGKTTDLGCSPSRTTPDRRRSCAIATHARVGRRSETDDFLRKIAANRPGGVARVHHQLGALDQRAVVDVTVIGGDHHAVILAGARSE